VSTKPRVAQVYFFASNYLVCLLLASVSCVAQQPRLSPNDFDNALKRFLQKELANPILGRDETTWFSAAVIKPDGNAKEEIVVYVHGRTWCGSGGCTMWILEPDGTSFKVIGKVTIVRLPIRVLQSKSHGHRDIGVWVQGGGIQPGYEALLRFDGKSYPDNPSVAPAKHLTETVAGEVLIGESDEGKPLYK